MKEVDTLSDERIYHEVRKILRIAKQAARKAQLENEQFGIPKIFSRNGIMYYEYADGTITTQKPDYLKKE